MTVLGLALAELLKSYLTAHTLDVSPLSAEHAVEEIAAAVTK